MKYDYKIELPKLQNIWENSNYYIVWKIKIEDFWKNRDTKFIKFAIKTGVSLMRITIYYIILHHHKFNI